MVDAAVDYDYTNTASVTDDGGANPTISDKAHPIIVSEGTGTGTGDCQFPSDAWNNVSDNSDIGVFDANDNALTFEIEELDTTNNEAVIWVFKSSLPRDNTDDVKVALGSGSTDDSDTEGTWGNTGQNAEMVQHLQDDPLTATDSTSNNNDGTVNGATSTTGEFDGAASFDGTDDVIDLDTSGSIGSVNGDVAWGVWAKHGGGSTEDLLTAGPAGDESWRLYSYEGSWRVIIRTDSGDSIFSSGDTGSGNWKHIYATFDSSSGEANLYIDGDNVATNTDIGSSATINSYSNVRFGYAGESNFSGDMDEGKVYEEPKSADWVQADYDASPKAGQTLFSWNGASSTPATETDTASTTNLTYTVQTSTETDNTIYITGNVKVNGSVVSGANVYVYDETKEKFIGQDETDSDGDYSVGVGIDSGDTVLVAVDYDDGTDRYGDEKSTVV